MNKDFLKAFTLAEMLVSILIISIALMAMAPMLTKKAQQKVPEVQIIEKKDSIPKGAIILWFGSQIPDGWVECSGQNIDEENFNEIKDNLEQNQHLPDLNQVFNNTDTELKWIIKIRD